MKSLFIATLLLFFGTSEGIGLYFQLTATAIIAFGAFQLAQRANSIAANQESTSLGALLLIVLLPVIAIVSALFSYNFVSIGYTVIFVIGVFSIYIYSRFYTATEIQRVTLWAMLLLAIICIVFEADQFGMALQATQTERGLLRFSPFGNHPNLIGHVFATGAVLALSFGLVAFRRADRIICLLSAAIFFTIVLAASSRGALLALTVASIVVIVVDQFRRVLVERMSPILLLGGGAAAASSVIILLFVNWGFLVQMLDLNSEYRGLSSGGSGRVHNWNAFLEIFMSSYKTMAIGQGLRSWDVEVMQFDSDSSYINLLYEVGLMPSLLVIVLLACRIFGWWRASVSDRFALASLGVIVFTVVESFFARYLLGIGNSAAYVTLLALLAPILPGIYASHAAR